MALPSRCSACRLWLAPQLTRCPRCGAKVPVAAPTIVVDPEAATRRLDANATVLRAYRLRWVVPKEAQAAHMGTYLYLKKHGKKKSDAYKLSRDVALQSRKGRWSWESQFIRSHKIMVVVSPKKNRYVLANPHEHADLILVHTRKKGDEYVDAQGYKFGRPVRTRLRRIERSSLQKKLKKEVREVEARKAATLARKERKKQKKGDLAILAEGIMKPSKRRKLRVQRRRRKRHA